MVNQEVQNSYCRSDCAIVFKGMLHDRHELLCSELSPTTGLHLSQPVIS